MIWIMTKPPFEHFMHCDTDHDREHKKPRILSMTVLITTELSAKAVTSVKQMIPRTSSITAAAKITLPLSVDMQCISFSVSTVMPTLVAVKMTPINKFSIHAEGPTL